MSQSIPYKYTVRMLLRQWALDELYNGNRLKAARIQKVIDRNILNHKGVD